MSGLRLVGAAVTALVLVGCGAQTSPDEVVAAAPDRTRDAGTAQMSMDFAISADEPAQALEMSSEGDIDFAADRAELSVDLGALPLPGGGELTMIIDGSTVYTQLPIPGATGWIRVDAAQVSEALTGMSSAPGGEDPTQALELLHGVSGDVTEVGSEEVRGEEATRYDFTTELSEAARQAPEGQREAVRQQFEMLGTDELAMSAWIDGDGRLRRLSYELDLGQMDLPEGVAAPTEGTAAFTLELYDFGTGVDIELPPEEDVTDFTDMLGDLEGQLPAS